MAMKKALDKKRLIAEIERERRKRVELRLREIRGLIREARRLRREQIALVRSQCRTARTKLRENCARRRDTARSEGSKRIETRRGELTRERAEEQLLREHDARGQKRRAVRSTRGERRAESDDEVRANIPESMVPVFDSVKRHIRGNDRKSRSEAFLEWAEENPGEVYAIQAKDAEREVARLVAEHYALEGKKPPRRSRTRGSMALADVPF